MSDRPSKDVLHNELEKLIHDTANKEQECAKYLENVRELLIKEPFHNDTYIAEEYRGHSGDSDYIISANVEDSAGVKCIRAYIWELKAPQCYIFEKDSNHRLRPSKDLINAENQLLNYYDESIGSDNFKEEFKIIHPSDILIGGIIIGCNKTQVKGDFRDDKKDKLYHTAKRIRDNCFYKNIQLKLMTWDYVLDRLRPPIQNEKHIENQLMVFTTEAPTDSITLTSSFSPQ